MSSNTTVDSFTASNDGAKAIFTWLDEALNKFRFRLKNYKKWDHADVEINWNLSLLLRTPSIAEWDQTSSIFSVA